jgi:hypothetical protein
MYNFRRFLTISGLAVPILGTGLTFGQTPTAGDLKMPPGPPAYASAAPVDSTKIDPTAPVGTLVMPASGTDTTSVLMNPTSGRTGSNGQQGSHPVAVQGNILGVNTVPTFGGAFAGQAAPGEGQLFKYTMVGNPLDGAITTTIPTNIDEIDWRLLNADGSLFQTVKFSPFSSLTLNSPNFQTAKYSSSPSPTQFGDAVQRAEFYGSLDHGSTSWHTMLSQTVVNKSTITVPYFVTLLLGNGTTVKARSYFTGTAPDGNTFVLMLDALFDFLFENEVVSQINLGSFLTDGINVTAFPNTFLFSLNPSNPNAPGGCCVLGFHTYFFDTSAVPQNRWLTIYESWISPGLFGAGFQDVSALSHELSETLNDPFLDNATPNWQFPGQPPGSTVCQNNLETGDPIEALPNATFPITIDGYTYHPQNEAMLPWFGMGTSNAINGAFSYPDTTVLPTASKPCGT